MNNDISKMNLLSIKIGFWSALLFTIAGIGYGAGMGVFFAIFQVPSWTDINSYADFMKSMPQMFFSLCQITAFLSGPLFILMLCSIYEYAQSEKKILVRIGICFGIIFVVLASMTYFVQFTVVPQNISNGQFQGLEQFVQLNPKSFIAAMANLGWGLFIGLALLFVAPVFFQAKLEKVIKWTLIISGVFCILMTIGYMLQNVTLSLIVTGMMDISLTVASISLCILFRKIGKLNGKL